VEGEEDGEDEEDGDGGGEDGDGGGEEDGEAEEGGEEDGEAEGDGECDGDGEGEGDGGGGGRLDVTVQVKLTEPMPPDGSVAVTVTAYLPDAADDMVPLISPLPLIDRPGGRSDAVQRGGCPAEALSDLTCNRIVVPCASCWLPGSSSRTAARRK